MLSAADAVQLRGLRSDFWVGIDGPEVGIRVEGRELKFSCDYDRAIKARMCVVGFPWKEIREGVRVDFAVTTGKAVYFQAEDADDEQYIGHLYVHVRQPDGQRRTYLIQAADFNPYIKN